MRGHTHITKVPIVPAKIGLLAAALLAVLLFPWAGNAQAAPAQAHHPGPAESLYLQLSSTPLDSARVFQVREASLGRSAIHITLDDGTIAFTKDVLGRITGAFFEGEGEVLLTPPDEVERRSMGVFTGCLLYTSDAADE